jgi:uncharacterized membrane protein
MPVIEHEVEIEASPETVFGLVSRVEEFARYCDAIETIVRLGDNRYRWRVRAAGLPLYFDVEITESVPPERFAWRSLSGVSNRGCYRLTPIDGGTRVSLRLEYSLKNRWVEAVVGKAAKPLVRRLSREIIGNVEAQLGSGRVDPG